MRRITIFAVICGCLLPMTRVRAEAVTPAEARTLAVDAEAVLINLNGYMADDCFHHGDFMGAVAANERIIALNPIGVEPYALAAWLLWSSHKYDEAQAMYDRMIAANPDDPRGYFEVGMYYCTHLKQDQEAVKWFEQAVKHGLGSPERHMYGIVLRRLGRNEEALAFWRQVLADDPENATAKREIDHLTGKAVDEIAPPPK